MPFADFAAIVGMTLVCALFVGAGGMAVLYLLRRHSFALQLVVVVLTAIVSLVAGVLAVSRAMYISPHDFLVVNVVTLVSAVVAVGVAWILARRLARSAASLRSLAHDMGDGTVVASQETDIAGIEFIELADELAATSRRLSESREQVARLDGARRELMTWISHDLRSPLSGLRAMTEALEDGMTDDPPRMHREMRVQVDRLTALVDSLFELSRISSGSLVLHREPLQLRDLVSDAVAEQAPVARAKHITLHEEADADHLVNGDVRQLSRVVANLVSNAIEHTPEGGEILLRTQQDGEIVELAVIDSGPGVADSDLPRIFDPGWRASSARTPGYAPSGSGGAGLGLAIARGIVEAHEGTVSARNDPGGFCLAVRIPAENDTFALR